MVHLRINEREPNPNPHVNFITVLSMDKPMVEEAARQLLRALAAQVKPIMKAHGFVVNSLEEVRFISPEVIMSSGRNWDHGETIELVLRSSTGSLLSTHYLMSTLCHELAHIKHMNHGPAFQALWRQLQQEVRAIQSKGYYGDGYWSSGYSLVSSARIAGQGIEMGELPEYMCGGAHLRVRPISYRRRNPKGPQTSKKRKAGARINSGAFDSVGKALNEDLEGEHKLHGIGFRKKAGSKRAREERALAAEQRIQALQGKASSSNPPIPPVAGDASESEDEKQECETDHDRRRALLEVTDAKDLDALRAKTLGSTQDFLLPSIGSSGEYEDVCRVEESRDVATTDTSASGEVGRTKTSPGDQRSTPPRKRRKTLLPKVIFTSRTTPATTEATKAQREGPWSCMICTLTNDPNHLACSACGTPRGESKWVGESLRPTCSG